jgi:hypothetical protein
MKQEFVQIKRVLRIVMEMHVVRCANVRFWPKADQTVKISEITRLNGGFREKQTLA